MVKPAYPGYEDGHDVLEDVLKCLGELGKKELIRV